MPTDFAAGKTSEFNWQNMIKLLLLQAPIFNLIDNSAIFFFREILNTKGKKFCRPIEKQQISNSKEKNFLPSDCSKI